MLIFSGKWGQSVGKFLVSSGVGEKGEIEFSKHKNGELRMIVKTNITSQDCIVVQSMAPEPNESFVELLLMVDVLKEKGARRIEVIIPFLGYSYQNRHFDGEPVSARVIARAISSSGADSVKVVDIHAMNCLEYFTVPVQNIETEKIFAKYIKNNDMNRVVVVGPDKGSRARVKRFAKMIDKPVLLLQKTRDEKTLDVVDLKIVEGEIDETCILIDDSVNSGGTVVSVSDLLRVKGAKKVIWMVTHFLGVKGSLEKVMNSADLLVTTNSVDHGLKESDKVKILEIEI